MGQVGGTVGRIHLLAGERENGAGCTCFFLPAQPAMVQAPPWQPIGRGGVTGGETAGARPAADVSTVSPLAPPWNVAPWQAGGSGAGSQPKTVGSAKVSRPGGGVGGSIGCALMVRGRGR